MEIVFPLFLVCFAWWLAWFLVLWVRYRQLIVACWKEPVLKEPVLIFESDDWGPGAVDDAIQLKSIAKLLSKYKDSQGRQPVMTLGVILAAPDSQKIKATDYKSYHRETLADEKFVLILKEMRKGVSAGVFSAQLHGMEHYWPDNLMNALKKSDQLKSLLDQNNPLRTELLPDTLQSRWLESGRDGVCFLTQSDIGRAVKEEIVVFRSLFGQVAKVIVPPTFVWFEQVEFYWRSFGLEYLVTPGFVATGRDSKGVMGVSGEHIYNGMRARSGLIYIVRNNYFEPARGHTVAQAMAALSENTTLGRPTLLEMHRFNFCDDEVQSRHSLSKLGRCIEQAQKNHPALRFISTNELGDMYLDPSSTASMIDLRILSRISVFMARLWACDAIRKWLYISGIFIFVKTLSVTSK